MAPTLVLFGSCFELKCNYQNSQSVTGRFCPWGWSVWSALFDFTTQSSQNPSKAENQSLSLAPHNSGGQLQRSLTSKKFHLLYYHTLALCTLFVFSSVISTISLHSTVMHARCSFVSSHLCTQMCIISPKQTGNRPAAEIMPPRIGSGICNVMCWHVCNLKSQFQPVMANSV